MQEKNQMIYHEDQIYIIEIKVNGFLGETFSLAFTEGEAHRNPPLPLMLKQPHMGKKNHI